MGSALELSILRLLLEYANDNKLADKAFIDRLVELVVNKKSLDDYVKNITFTNRYDKSENIYVVATYSVSDKDIKIDYESICMMLDSLQHYECLFNSTETIMYRNCAIVQVLLHELEHAYQNKLIDDSEKHGIESWLLNLSIGHKVVGIKNLKEYLQNYIRRIQTYSDLYRFNPSERLAEIKSHQTILNILTNLKKDLFNLYSYYNVTLYEKHLLGYEDVVYEGECPTSIYLCCTGSEEAWQKILRNCDTGNGNPKATMMFLGDFAYRTKFGLPISIEEYESAQDYIKASPKHNI